MGLDLIPRRLRKKYQIEEREHACAILAQDFPVQFKDILDCLDAFWLKKSYITAKGGARSPVSFAIDEFLQGSAAALALLREAEARKAAEEEGQSIGRRKARTKKEPKRPPVAPIGDPAGRGWTEKEFRIAVYIDESQDPIPVPTHKIDNYKRMPGTLRGVGVEVEWNNKDPFFDRDLNNFRLLRQMGVLSVGVIITRQTELQTRVFKPLGKGHSYGAATTHWDKLIPKVDSGAAGGCPLLLVGMGTGCYVDDGAAPATREPALAEPEDGEDEGAQPDED